MSECGYCKDCKWWLWGMSETGPGAGQCTRLCHPESLFWIERGGDGQEPFDSECRIITRPGFGCIQWKAK